MKRFLHLLAWSLCSLICAAVAANAWGAGNLLGLVLFSFLAVMFGFAAFILSFS